jgi:hypothetical protein
MEVLFEVRMRLVRGFFDGGLFAGAVHALDLAIRPGMIGFGAAVLDGVLLTHTRKDMLEGILIPPAIGELHAVVRQDRVDLLGYGVDEVTPELRRDGLDGLRVQLGIGTLARAVNGDEQVEPAFFGTYFGHIEVEVSDRIGLEFFSSAACRLPDPASGCCHAAEDTDARPIASGEAAWPARHTGSHPVAAGYVCGRRR